MSEILAVGQRVSLAPVAEAQQELDLPLGTVRAVMKISWRHWVDWDDGYGNGWYDRYQLRAEEGWELWMSMDHSANGP